MKKTSLTFKLGIRGVRVWPLCLFLLLASVQAAFAGDLAINPDGGKIQSHEKILGPFRINEKDFRVILTVLEFTGASQGFDKTVKSVSIVDAKGKVHFENTFHVTYDSSGFSESIGVSAFTLDSRGKRGFSIKSGELERLPSKEVQGVGLVLYYGFTPTAPLSGSSCQVFVLKGEHLVPQFSPLTVYGRIYELPRGDGPNSLKLHERDTMSFGVWTGWFEVVVPVKVHISMADSFSSRGSPVLENLFSNNPAAA